MGIFSATIRRGFTSDLRKEDFYQVYGCEPHTIDEGKHMDYTYKITTTGNYPTVYIEKPAALSSYSGKVTIKVLDRNGEEKEMKRIYDDWASTTYFWYEYNKNEDYINDNTGGKKYTAENLKSDVIAFIEQIEKEESNFVKTL